MAMYLDEGSSLLSIISKIPSATAALSLLILFNLMAEGNIDPILYGQPKPTGEYRL